MVMRLCTEYVVFGTVLLYVPAGGVFQVNMFPLLSDVVPAT